MALVDTTTGEVVVREDAASALERAADPGEFVVQCLERGKTWLAEALEHGDLDALVNMKGYAETLRVATMQKQLGHDAELSAAELVRRAERSIGLAVRAGQASGDIATKGDHTSGWRARQLQDDDATTKIVSPSDVFAHSHERQDVYAITDGVSDEVFDAAVTDARAEGNLTRANVVRKVKERVPPMDRLKATAAANNGDERRNRPLQERTEQIRRLAAKNMTSPQIGDELRLSPERVRQIAKDTGIEITADAVFGGKFRKVDPNSILDAIVDAATPEPVAVARIAYSELDAERIPEWVSSLEAAIKSLQAIKSSLKKELTRDQQ